MNVVVATVGLKTPSKFLKMVKREIDSLALEGGVICAPNPMLGDEQSLGVDHVFITITTCTSCKEISHILGLWWPLATVGTMFGI